MKPDPKYRNMPLSFWGAVKSVSQTAGYTTRGANAVKAPCATDIGTAFRKLGLDPKALQSDLQGDTLLNQLHHYFEYRARVLNDEIRPLLMDAAEAKELFERTRARLKPKCPMPLNKQKGEKSGNAYLTCLVNMLVEEAVGGAPVDYDPKALTTVTVADVPIRTLSRRVDGAFPSTVNPVAIWEIKEYYYTTTFGSRVADGVYETLLDGMEIEEIRKSQNIDIRHYLFIDAKFTWWVKGKSYLCRLIDMVNMGYVDEVIVGRAVVDRVPALAKEWLALRKK